jgi:hypothetical protein
MEMVFSVTQEADGGFVAECLSHDIFTQGNNWIHCAGMFRKPFPLISLTSLVRIVSALQPRMNY